MQVLAVVDAADSGLSVASGQDLQHVWWDVVLGLVLLIRLFVQTLQARETKQKNNYLPDTSFMCECLRVVSVTLLTSRTSLPALTQRAVEGSSSRDLGRL